MKCYDEAKKEAREFHLKCLENCKTIEEKLKRMEIAERQKYNYYCDCSDRWTAEQCEEYNASWDAILEIIEELNQQKNKGKA